MNFNREEIMNFKNIIITLFLVFLAAEYTDAQYRNVWMSAGSLHSWYSEIGSELEEAGFIRTQQFGLQYPAIYPYQDMQAARGMWLGARDFTDERGNYYPYKVVTIGPRAPAFYAAFPQEFKVISKFEPSFVTVDGLPTYDKDVELDEIDESMPWDRMIHSVINTQLGITIDRKIKQFSQQFNDNYIIYDYTFTNTGNTDNDADIELPDNTVVDAYFFFTFRNSVVKQTRFIIGNNSGWGINTMNDFRGDGVEIDPPDENFRAQFSWHGYYTEGKQVAYDNIGGPIWAISATARPFFPDQSDTVGRLGATHFLGTVTLHADKSATEKIDDPAQPSTTTYENSDSPVFLAGANAFNTDRMTREYEFMTKGHQAPRHARLVEPSGDYALQTSPPNVGNASGGISYNVAYGPYTIAPGEDVRIVFAEGAGQMGRADQIRIGRQFRNGQITAVEKNREVMKSRDSLFQTFRRAIDNFNSEWNIPQPPRPPATFEVAGGGDRIRLSWTPAADDPNPAIGYNIYRAEQNIDSTYHLIYNAGAGETSFDDVNPTRGVDYYYYISAYGPPQAGGPGTPAGSLESSRYYTQTYDPARLKRPAGTELSKIRIVPNPFVISGTTPSGTSPGVRYPGDRIGFLNIPGNCTIRIYTELGELINTIEHNDGSGDEFWYSVTSSNQIVVSGIYIAVITDNDTGKNQIEKFAVIR
jgi:hypothetical protein